MNVAELISILEDMPEDAEVRLAEQPRWAFEYSVNDVVLAGEEANEDDREVPAGACVYIVEGSQLGYLPGSAKEAIGWDR